MNSCFSSKAIRIIILKPTDGGLLVVHKERMASVKEIKAMADFGMRLRTIIENSIVEIC